MYVSYTISKTQESSKLRYWLFGRKPGKPGVYSLTHKSSFSFHIPIPSWINILSAIYRFSHILLFSVITSHVRFFHLQFIILSLSHVPIYSLTNYSRNNFHFSEVHGSMNATGHVQSPSGFMLTLHRTRCVHTSMNLRKMKFISFVYNLFLHRFCSLFVKFWFKSCK